MNYYQRYFELNSLFNPGVDLHLSDSGVDIRFFDFCSKPDANHVEIPGDNFISENYSFNYPVFIPSSGKPFQKAILLLHGLNERSWVKYLTWAEYLCQHTEKPVILFPIAFHMNRSPMAWSNPRVLQPVYDLRKLQIGVDRSMSFANVALSERISESPHRFYSSGRQSMNDITQLLFEIKIGEHSLFAENTQVDIFAYSIGAFLSQVIFMSNPRDLFSDSKLFMFCGGSIFSSMFGESRSIMDKVAFERLLKYYKNDFSIEGEPASFRDRALESFYSMIAPERNKDERLSFFRKLGERISGISLKRDTVIPYSGVQEAMGKLTTEKQIRLFDFSFEYFHENPFPVNGKVNVNELNSAFNDVFTDASLFLA